MWSWINKNSGGLQLVVFVGLTILGGIYGYVTIISELKTEISELKNNQISDQKSFQDLEKRVINNTQALEKRVIFLERVKMLSPMKDKLDITSLARNSVTNKLSNEQFNETFNIIKNEAPNKAMKILEEKSYFNKKQIPSIFTNQSENREDK